MVLRRCPNCGTVSDDRYGFCIKCGTEFPKINTTNQNICIVCGYKNVEGATRCVKCGTPLMFNNPKGDLFITKPIILSKENSKSQNKPKKNYNIIIVLGYIFAILGGAVGLIIALYLITRSDLNAKKHGSIQLGILIFYLVLILAFFLTGRLDMNMLNNYTQMLNNNMTNLWQL